MKIFRNTLISLVVLCFTTTLFSQNSPSKAFYFKGRVISEKNKPLPFTHVINLIGRYATITDSTGHFRLPVLLGDSVMFSCIGYHTKYVHVDERNSEIIHTIALNSQTYNLPIVNISELRWQVFKSEFMEKKIKENKTQKNISNWKSKLISPEELRMIYQNANRKDWLYLNRYKR